jgi:two-component system invasion response regulator UvrY
MSIRILLADDHAVVRSGLRRLLEQRPGFEVVAEAETGEEAYQVFNEHRPDVAVMDLSMPGMGGLEAIRRILLRDAAARLLVFSMHENAAFASQALKAGARGYVTKTGASDELVTAIQEVARGKVYISKEIAQKIAMQTLGGGEDPMRELSTREFEVFRLIAEGRNSEEIGEMLKISQKTVANYQTLIKQKLNVTTSVELIRLAIRQGVIEN